MADTPTPLPTDSLHDASDAGAAPDVDGGPGPDGPRTTRLATTWLFKTVIFLVVLFGLGAWGLADALHFYPRRGALDASLKLKAHLEASQSAGKLRAEDLKMGAAGLDAEYAALAEREIDLRRASAGGEAFAKREADRDLTRYEWLQSLKRMWDLDADPKLVHEAAGKRLYFDPATGEGYETTGGAAGPRQAVPPAALLAQLTQKWTTTTPATPLSGLDMVFQWVFVAVGFGGGLYLLVMFLRAASKRFAWEPAGQRLTLPGGETIGPGDLADLDKRLWHKFYVTLLLKDGRSRTLDLYRYSPLEDWVLAMERTAFPQRAAEEAARKEAAASRAAESSNEPVASPNE